MINERIQQLIDTVSSGNKRAFSKLLNVNPTVIENIVGTRKGKPGYDLLEKIILSIENINTEWLFTGKGSMLKPNKDFNNSDSASMIAADTQVKDQRSEESILYKMYREEKEEKEALLKQIGRLEQKLSNYETISPPANVASSEKSSSKRNAVTSASVQSKK